MISVKIISTGSLKEEYLRGAVAEYAKRLSGYCKFSEVVLKESKLPDSPSEREISAALDAEAKNILAEISPRSSQPRRLRERSPTFQCRQARSFS